MTGGVDKEQSRSGPNLLSQTGRWERMSSTGRRLADKTPYLKGPRVRFRACAQPLSIGAGPEANSEGLSTPRPSSWRTQHEACAPPPAGRWCFEIVCSNTSLFAFVKQPQGPRALEQTRGHLPCPAEDRSELDSQRAPEPARSSSWSTEPGVSPAHCHVV